MPLCRAIPRQRRMLTGVRGRGALLGLVQTRRQARQDGEHARVRERQSSAVSFKRLQFVARWKQLLQPVQRPIVYNGTCQARMKCTTLRSHHRVGGGHWINSARYAWRPGQRQSRGADPQCYLTREVALVRKAKMFDNASSAVDRGYSGQQPFPCPNRLDGAATSRAKNDLDFNKQLKNIFTRRLPQESPRKVPSRRVVAAVCGV